MSIYKIAKRAANKMISKRAETKQHDFTDTDSIEATTPTAIVFEPGAVSAGDGDGQRDGNMISITGIHSNILLKNANQNPYICRIVMGYAKDISGTPSASTMNSYFSPDDIVDPDDWVILRDMMVTMPSSGSGTDVKVVKFNHKFKKGFIRRFNGTTAADTVIRRLFIGICSDATAGEPITCTWSGSCYYKDI